MYLYAGFAHPIGTGHSPIPFAWSRSGTAGYDRHHLELRYKRPVKGCLNISLVLPNLDV